MPTKSSDHGVPPLAGDVAGIRLRYLVSPAVFLACVAVALCGMVFPSLALVDKSQMDASNMHDGIVEFIVTMTNNYFVQVQAVAQNFGLAYSEGLVDLRNETTARVLTTMVFSMCAPSCSVVYFVLTDNYYMFRYQDRFCTPDPVSSNVTCCPISANAAPSPASAVCATPFKDNGEGVYLPTTRPWYGPLASAAGWTPLYADFTTLAAASTVGGPIRRPSATGAGPLLGVVVADVDFSPLARLIRLGVSGFLKNGSKSGFVIYEAGTLIVLDTSDGFGKDGLVTLPKLNTTAVTYARSRVANWSVPSADYTTSRLFDNVFVSIRTVGPPPAARGTAPGLDLRVLIAIFESDTSTNRASVDVAIGLTVCVVVALSALFALVAVFTFERPLGRVAKKLSSTAENVLALKDSESDDDAADASHDDPESSSIYELTAIVASFGKLQAELQRLRAFVPRSVMLGGRDVETPPPANDAAPPECEDDLSSVTSKGSDDDSTPRREVLTVGPAVADGIGTRTSSNETAAAAGGQSQRPSLVGAYKRVLLQRQLSISKRSESGGRHMLYTQRDLGAAHVSFVTVAIRDLDAAIESLSDAKFAVRLCECFAWACDAASTRFKGVVDGYSGDRATVTFNAVRPNPSHKRSAAEFIVSLARAVQQFSLPLHGPPDLALNKETLEWAGTTSTANDRQRPLWRGVSAGIASGPALIGNVGCDALTRFAVMGDLVARSMQLELRCRALKPSDPSREPTIPCLCGGEFVNDMSHSVAYMVIDCAADGSRVLAPMRMLLGHTASQTTAAAADGHDTEWMYELQRAERDNEFALINEAFDAYLCGRVDLALPLLAAAEQRSEQQRASCAVGIARLRELLLSR